MPLYCVVVNSGLSSVLVKNKGDRPITIARNVRLGAITEYDFDCAYLATPYLNDKVISGLVLRFRPYVGNLS